VVVTRRWTRAGLGLLAVTCLAAAAAAAAGSAAAGLPLVPLSTLGRLVSPGSPGPIGPEGVPVPIAPPLAPAGPITLGQSIDGIQCEPSEQVLFHIHAHLTLFVNGKPRQIPYGIGIGTPHQVVPTPSGSFVGGGSCFAWLHTHAADGIVHIESPVKRTYTLGNFFDVWQQPLNKGQVGPAHGHVTALYDGRVYTGDPRSIPMFSHAEIQLEVGRPLVRPVQLTSWNGL
jgi:hypothetical protein